MTLTCSKCAWGPCFDEPMCPWSDMKEVKDKNGYDTGYGNARTGCD